VLHLQLEHLDRPPQLLLLLRHQPVLLDQLELGEGVQVLAYGSVGVAAVRARHHRRLLRVDLAHLRCERSDKIHRLVLVDRGQFVAARGGLDLGDHPLQTPVPVVYGARHVPVLFVVGAAVDGLQVEERLLHRDFLVDELLVRHLLQHIGPLRHITFLRQFLQQIWLLSSSQVGNATYPFDVI
jgi:hypothetical protein